MQRHLLLFYSIPGKPPTRVSLLCFQHNSPFLRFANAGEFRPLRSATKGCSPLETRSLFEKAPQKLLMMGLSTNQYAAHKSAAYCYSCVIEASCFTFGCRFFDNSAFFCRSIYISRFVFCYGFQFFGYIFGFFSLCYSSLRNIL